MMVDSTTINNMIQKIDTSAMAIPPRFEIIRLRRLYMLALGTIAAMAIIGQIAVQYVLRNDKTNARIVNIAGRQRMLSQQICKLAMQIAFVDPSLQPNFVEKLRAAQTLWRQSHNALQFGDATLGIPEGKNSRQIQEMFAKLNPTFQRMDSLVEAAARFTASTRTSPVAVATVGDLLRESEVFLPKMNAIVFQYDEEFHAAVQRLQMLEGALFLLTLLTLGLEAFFIFRPAVQHLETSVNMLEAQNEEFSSSNELLRRQQDILEAQARELEMMNTQVQEQNVELERHRHILQGQMLEMERMLREVQEARRVQSEFLANLSHEFRTPLSAIMGFTEILHEDFVSPDGMPFMRQIKKSANVLLVMLNDMIDLAQIEAGQIEIRLAPGSIRSVIDEICTTLHIEAQTKKIDFKHSVAPDVPRSLVFDIQRTRQIVFHIVNNAVKFTSQGSIDVRVFYLSDVSILRIEVQDTGVGISSQQMERIFAPFVQEDGSTTRKHGGLGIGLALVKRIVGLQKGSIHAESEPQKGSTFTIDLPCQERLFPMGSPFLPIENAQEFAATTTPE
ncbi:MAG: hypothetical protein EAZ92_07910 [Candidatus Kapaibacterium sp.]|nr:MAG: hypothetical protein EAZ92_07910 [Candidatus Kapabacteria bacterium]